MKPITINNSKRLGLNTGVKGIITPTNEKSIKLYFDDIKNLKFESGLTKEEEFNLSLKIKQGDEAAKVRLINANLRFVISVAKMYINQGLPFEDLVNEGNIGLITAVDKFDPHRDIKFLSFAVWYIRQSILTAIADKGRNVRVPINKKESLNKVNKRIAELEKNLERKPTIEEIVDISDGFDYNNILDIMSSGHTEVSLDEPLSNKYGDEAGNLYDMIAANDIDETTPKEEIRKDVSNLLLGLPYKERRIVQMFFGVLLDRKYTLDEIAVEFNNCSRERIRQIKDKSIQKLRNHPDIKKFLQYV